MGWRRCQLYRLPLLVGAPHACGHVGKPVLFPESREMLIFLSLRRTKKLSSFELQFNLSTGCSCKKLLALFKKIPKHQIPSKTFPNGKICLFLSLRMWKCASLKLCNTTWVGRTGGKKL